jgi:hypothetical protein
MPKKRAEERRERTTAFDLLQNGEGVVGRNFYYEFTRQKGKIIRFNLKTGIGNYATIDFQLKNPREVICLPIATLEYMVLIDN